jgi:hypothetical protein
MDGRIHCKTLALNVVKFVPAAAQVLRFRENVDSRCERLFEVYHI